MALRMSDCSCVFALATTYDFNLNPFLCLFPFSLHPNNVPFISSYADVYTTEYLCYIQTLQFFLSE